VVVRAETEVATPRTDVTDPVVFATLEKLNIASCSLSRTLATTASGAATDHTRTLRTGKPFDCFQKHPETGDALAVGLSSAVPSCAVVIRVDCTVRGVGIDPDRPPRVWEAWTRKGWQECEVERDDTFGLNKSGDVLLHVPEEHVASTLAEQRAGWLRCRLVPVVQGQPEYRESPQIVGLSAFTIGATARMAHVQVIRDEVVGTSDGAPAQRFPLQRGPVVPWESRSVLRVIDETGVSEWTEVEHFATSGPQDRHFHIDAGDGMVVLGPAVRESDGSLRRYGDVPAKGAQLQLSSYRVGGGAEGNIDTGRIRVLKTSVPYVSRVENRQPAVGGARGEDIEDAKRRGPLVLRSRGRAVTAEDFEELTKEVAPEIARVLCVPDQGAIRVLVVPGVERDTVGRVRREDLLPLPESLERITHHLDERRLIGTRLFIEPPDYRWLTAVVNVRLRPRYQSDLVRQEILAAVYRLLDPLCGGPEGLGWPIGRAVQSQEISALLAQIAGVDMSEEVGVELYLPDPQTHRRSSRAPVSRVSLEPGELVFSYEHHVVIRP
jgi:predicted phage baseplate assembly protein